MDLLDVLETMAGGVTVNEHDCETLEAQTRRFQDLFNYSSTTVKDIIEYRRQDPFRKTVSDEHWKMVRQEKEAEGYDKEAYEYAVEAGLVYHKNHIDRCQQESDTDDFRGKYLVKLEGPIDCARAIQHLTGTLEIPTTVKGTGNSGEANFCLINGMM